MIFCATEELPQSTCASETPKASSSGIDDEKVSCDPKCYDLTHRFKV